MKLKNFLAAVIIGCSVTLLGSSVTLALAQTNVLYANVADILQTPAPGQTLTLQRTSPLNGTWGPSLTLNLPRTHVADANGNVTWTNVLYGNYRLFAPGSVATGWSFPVYTNTLGSNNIAALVTNTAPVPDPATNYVTWAQLAAEFTGFGNGTYDLLGAAAAATNGLPNGAFTVNPLTTVPVGATNWIPTAITTVTNSPNLAALGANNGSGLTNLNAAANGLVANGATNVSLVAPIISMAQIGGLSKSRMPGVWYIAGDSTSQHLLGTQDYLGRSAGWLSHCKTNASLASTATNQADGTVWFNTGGAYTTTNESLWVFFTNYVSALGYQTRLDNSMCVPGQNTFNIGEGAPSWATWTTDQTYGGNTYSSSGNYSQTFAIQGNWTDSIYFTTNDYTFSYTNAAGSLVVLTNPGVYPYGGTYSTISAFSIGLTPGGYRTGYFTGITNAPVGVVITTPYFAGMQSAFGPPWQNNGTYNNTTNNVPVCSWLDTNAPNVTGIPAGFILDSGVNNANGGTGLNWAAMPAPYVTNAVHWGQTNVNYILGKAMGDGFWPVYLVTPPYCPSIGSGQISNCLAEQWVDMRATPASICTAIIDLAATNLNSGASLVAGNFMDNTHPYWGFATIENANVLNYLGFQMLPVIPAISIVTNKLVSAPFTPVNGAALRWTNNGFYWGL